jgi:hypothetical protein
MKKNKDFTLTLIMSMNNIYTPIVHCRILSLASILDLRSSDDICCVDMELSYTSIGYKLDDL